MDQFLAQIFAVIHQIPHGKVSTYGEIARMAGYPGYARHVGKALGNLPKDSKLPWFRVINSKGEISLTGPDWDRQRERLVAEGITVSSQGKISLRIYKWQP
ncbi:DNA base-flipping protein [Vibrio fluvialis]|uniref:MGMT family protein n=1 Tax=Vibrio fluvialis TaxID=676 RepID=UPI001C9C9050|nr:DNA base-flipping protein [Vibrio fluvialis]MBY7948102.1 DNA base-flipping protein [Vibrio fluvialis]MBY7998488.1 DNA base-flipping protein [Vibrio fluvialis]MBY8012290.1 DNA base-flipping protein [Vibrio fluvialis]MBY8016370.1 DNA base-flipping protein [Vibrio fluvialis]